MAQSNMLKAQPKDVSDIRWAAMQSNVKVSNIGGRWVQAMKDAARANWKAYLAEKSKHSLCIAASMMSSAYCEKFWRDYCEKENVVGLAEAYDKHMNKLFESDKRRNKIA